MYFSFSPILLREKGELYMLYPPILDTKLPAF
jgi:hypothetical protein